MDDDKRQYMDTLKGLNRPSKVKVESREKILMEAEQLRTMENMLHEMTEKEKQLRLKLIEWFLKNPYPDDNKVHAFAKQIGIDEHELEKHIYAIISSVLSEGKSKGKEIKHDPKQLEMGIKVEMEHTSCPTISRKIALDHLAEIPDYYTRLDKMEKEAGVEHHD